jgi:hypothetical protein
MNEILDDLRRRGWRVAVHNDYEQNGKLMTFWLLTHPRGYFVKGEGETDLAALHICGIGAAAVWAAVSAGAA